MQILGNIFNAIIFMSFIGSIFTVISLFADHILRCTLPLWELLVIYLPPTFFLSSLCALLGIFFTQEHIATLICGIVWLIVLLIRSLLRLPGVEYIYLFIRYADSQDSIWLWNKGIITTAGFFLWGIIYIYLDSMTL